MMKSFQNIALFFFCFLTCISCSSRKTQSINNKESAITYAKGFDISKTDSNYTKLTVLDPWNDYKTHSIYYLVKDSTIITPADGSKIQIPIKNAVVNSATYLGFMQLLDVLPSVSGICNTKYIYNPYILEEVKLGKVTDLGDSYNLDMEKLLLLQPEVIFNTGYNGDTEDVEKYKRFKLTPVYNIEWQEPSLLGRAEWIKFIAEFYDKSSEANDIFDTIVTNYLASEKIAQTTTASPTILSGQDFRGTWSMPAGASFLAQLFQAAKADYFYKDDTSYQGSIPLTIEEALINFHEADFWFNVQANSLEELANLNDKYKLFKAYKEGNVYNINNKVAPQGGNDYWEMGVAKPDLILKDYIKVLHPDLLPEYELTFLKKLSE